MKIGCIMKLIFQGNFIFSLCDSTILKLFVYHCGNFNRSYMYNIIIIIIIIIIILIFGYSFCHKHLHFTSSYHFGARQDDANVQACSMNLPFFSSCLQEAGKTMLLVYTLFYIHCYLFCFVFRSRVLLLLPSCQGKKKTGEKNKGDLNIHIAQAHHSARHKPYLYLKLFVSSMFSTFSLMNNFLFHQVGSLVTGW